MREFDYFVPATVDEAVNFLAAHGNKTVVVAGGTDVVIELYGGLKRPEKVLDMSKLDELRFLREEGGVVHVGALNTFSSLDRNDYVVGNHPALREAARHVGSPQIRALGTIGGNVVNASVAGDMPTVLEAYGAEVVLQSLKEKRVMGIAAFNEGPANCQIRPDELLTEVHFPVLSDNEAVGYFKIGRRKSLAIVVLAVSIYIRKTDDGKVEDSRVILGAVSMHPMRAPKVEEALCGLTVKPEELYGTLPLFTEAIDKAIPTRASLVYKREAVRGAARRAYDMILGRFGQLSEGSMDS